jgi:hypothetical protein
MVERDRMDGKWGVRLPGKSGLMIDHILKLIAGGVAEEYGDGGGVA